MSTAAAARSRGGNGGGWLHAAWLVLTGGATPAEQLLTTEEVAGGGGFSLTALTARNSISRYELVSTEDSDNGDETSWESDSEPASETELSFILPREEEDPKTTTTTNSIERIFACDELRMSKPEFWRWSSNSKSIAAGEAESMAAAAVAESEPLILTRRRGAKRINDAEMEKEDHPFCFDRHGRMVDGVVVVVVVVVVLAAVFLIAAD